MPVVPQQTVILTRMGVGVYDLEWWRVRLSIFDVVTASSVSAMRGRSIVWYLILDEDVPGEVLDSLHEIISRRGLGGIATFIFVADSTQISRGMRQALITAAPSSARLHVQLLDDDDAITTDLHDAHLDVFDEEFAGPQIASTLIGLAVDAPRLRMGSRKMPSYPVNTTFYGTAASVLRAMRTSHTQWLSRAPSIGGRAYEVADSAHPSWLYLVHEQADGGYAERSRDIGAAGDLAPLASDQLARFGIDHQEFVSAVELLREAPPTLGLTWRRTQPQILRLADARLDVARVKREMVKINSNIFDRSTPFFYLRRPLPRAELTAGSVQFTGTGTPGSTIEIWLSGAGEPRLIGTSICDAESGSWAVTFKIAASTNWKIEIRQVIAGNAVNEIRYDLVVNP